jgi:hypothetical protein
MLENPPPPAHTHNRCVVLHTTLGPPLSTAEHGTRPRPPFLPRQNSCAIMPSLHLSLPSSEQNLVGVAPALLQSLTAYTWPFKATDSVYSKPNLFANPKLSCSYQRARLKGCLKRFIRVQQWCQPIGLPLRLLVIFNILSRRHFVAGIKLFSDIFFLLYTFIPFLI